MPFSLRVSVFNLISSFGSTILAKSIDSEKHFVCFNKKDRVERADKPILND